MNPADDLPISFPPIERHGVIGDRRTGALVAADGTINWFCVPNFDGPPLFGTLLDPDCGGFCRFGPARASVGRQHYLPETAALVTSWRGSTHGNCTLELTDVMAWPADERPQSASDQRVIVRRLQATFWFVHALAKAGRADEAEAILRRCEAMAGELGLFAEEADARRQTFLDNTPLLFAHVEYVRAAAEMARAHGLRSQKL
jgi:GH15 family glucan-1,4-alpha-glucosidase